MNASPHDHRQLERLVFFSDAIFAIAITLLVIEIRIPELHDVTEQKLADALLALVPQYIGFLVSFFVIGRFWIGHHRVFGLLDRTDDTLVWRNLVFLLTIAFMPFPTALVSEYASTRVAVGFYASWLLIAGLLNMWLLRHATRGPLLVEGSEVAVQLNLRGPWIPVVIAATALCLTAFNPAFGMLALVCSPLISRVVTWRRKLKP